MHAARRLLARRPLAVLLCAAVLLLKLLVPAGYMIGTDRGRVTIELCSGMAGQPMAMAGMHHAMPGHDEGHGKDHGKPDTPCAFAGLSAATLGAVDPVQLAAHVAFVMAAGIAPAVVQAAIAPAYLRPPLRGPPANR